MTTLSQQLADTRQDYAQASLGIADVGIDPIAFFERWIAEAKAANVLEVNAMTLCTISQNQPHARIVLLKGIENGQFIFYTNYDSHKAIQIGEHQQVALVFFWKELERQVRIEGIASKVPRSMSEQYFNSRPLASRIGALASPQSSVIASRDVLEAAVQRLCSLPLDQIKLPSNWGGYQVAPSLVEFWQGRTSRLHDRIIFTKQNNNWTKQRLAP